MRDGADGAAAAIGRGVHGPNVRRAWGAGRASNRGRSRSGEDENRKARTSRASREVCGDLTRRLPKEVEPRRAVSSAVPRSSCEFTRSGQPSTDGCPQSHQFPSRGVPWYRTHTSATRASSARDVARRIPSSDSCAGCLWHRGPGYFGPETARESSPRTPRPMESQTGDDLPW